LAQAWASLDGKLKQFDAEKDMPPRSSIWPISRIYGHGHYAGG
jgi:hypothetical protein